MLRNTKGGLYLVIMGIMIVAIGAISYIVVSAVFLGTGGTSKGLFQVAVDDLGINASDTTFMTIKNVWRLLPLAIVLGGVFMVIMGAQRREYEEYTYAPRRV